MQQVGKCRYVGVTARMLSHQQLHVSDSELVGRLCELQSGWSARINCRELRSYLGATPRMLSATAGMVEEVY